MQSILQKTYQEKVAPALQKELGISNRFAVPALKKVTINIGVGKIGRDDKVLERITSNLQKISGQKPVRRLAKKSIASFKVREGMTVGLMTTLRGQRMYHFVEKLIHIVFPRIRDFRGINPKSIDEKGNLSIGVREHMIFPEIGTEDLDPVHGLQIDIETSARTREQGLTLFTLLGFPFAKEEAKKR